MLSAKATQLVNKAVDRLMEQGWTQGRFLARKPEGGYSYCMAGALMEAAGAALVDEGGEMYTLLIQNDQFELDAYREVSKAYEETFGVHLFKGNDEADSMEDIVLQMLWLQIGDLDATQAQDAT